MRDLHELVLLLLVVIDPDELVRRDPFDFPATLVAGN